MNIHNLYFVSPRERPWRQHVFQRKTIVTARATCVFSHEFKKEHRDWRVKDASCSVYHWARHSHSLEQSIVKDHRTVAVLVSNKKWIYGWRIFKFLVTYLLFYYSCIFPVLQTAPAWERLQYWHVWKIKQENIKYNFLIYTLGIVNSHILDCAQPNYYKSYCEVAL